MSRQNGVCANNIPDASSVRPKSSFFIGHLSEILAAQQQKGSARITHPHRVLGGRLVRQIAALLFSVYDGKNWTSSGNTESGSCRGAALAGAEPRRTPIDLNINALAEASNLQPASFASGQEAQLCGTNSTLDQLNTESRAWSEKRRATIPPLWEGD
jgi:hypothetical protein